MVGGQAIDLGCSTPDRDGQRTPTLDADGLRVMHSKKTGALIRASALAGAIMGGAGDSMVGQIDVAATELGLAFQIVDDILDVEGVSADLGKTAGKDAAAGKPTYPTLYGLDTARRMAAECLERAESALGAAGLVNSRLMEIGRWIRPQVELTSKIRLDQLVTDKGLAPSRERARGVDHGRAG